MMFYQRIKRVREKLKEQKLDGLLISSAPNIFYLTGIIFFEPTEREGFLLITRNKNYLITSSLYAEAVGQHLGDTTLLETTVSRSIKKNLKDVLEKSPLRKVGFEEDSLTVSEYADFRKLFNLSPGKGIIEKLRSQKDEYEIQKIRKASQVTDQAFDYILKKIHTGVTEIELSHQLSDFFKIKDMTDSFSPVIAFGPHSSLPHHISGNTKLKKNQIVLMDFGAKYEGYCSDFTRTVFFGKADGKFRKIYNAVLDSQTKAFDLLIKNKHPKRLSVDKAARDYIISQGFPSIPHSLGHGIGIQVHEGERLAPKVNVKIENNTVFSIEPGIYIPGFGGVRIEDLVLYQNGPKFITCSNKDLIEL